MLFKLMPGACGRSFGLHVARVAQFPPHVVHDAERLAQQLEGKAPADPAPPEGPGAGSGSALQ